MTKMFNVKLLATLNINDFLFFVLLSWLINREETIIIERFSPTLPGQA